VPRASAGAARRAAAFVTRCRGVLAGRAYRPVCGRTFRAARAPATGRHASAATTIARWEFGDSLADTRAGWQTGGIGYHAAGRL